ncbi:MAG: hypothetical protein GY793_01385 [Proteobacteria bacterium]|nr:hypothetical protein [Pseudomonadota bacterium]
MNELLNEAKYSIETAEKEIKEFKSMLGKNITKKGLVISVTYTDDLLDEKIKDREDRITEIKKYYNI